MKTFEIDDDQEKKLEKWKREHKEKCKKWIESTEGVKLIYIFTPTGLGTIVVVKCICGKELNLTDSDKW